ncbi:hypothetical protein SUGI_0750400 [Cryptomeria japonica]|uniref:E4 SUMO-protein ligase PIAL1 n=1 Tax=Cryptomeria japonica TaxID=3369 RepID=UPI002414CC1F|nr:E4 SUMO-protein ligase PIAL1 [Cryptomeria japonica]GLJ37033.1 hypothetical protein SUGI_0750400 [Cryptomeria japonica]
MGVDPAAGKMTSQVASAELLRQATERMRKLLRIGYKVDSKDIFQLCILLAKAIDSAVVYNQVPAMVHDLPQLVKQVFERKEDTRLQPAIMVLMLSVKNACRNGWFRVTDTDELLTMSKELTSCFTSMGETPTIETSNAMNIISSIIPRFYPRLSLASILVSLEVKQGYEVLATDFHIGKRPAPHEKIRLLVVRADGLETSACLVTPSQVNFLLNGKGVEKRCNLSMDTGPQMPTDVTNMLKIGTNLLQAIGDFNGNYLIAITMMSACPSASPPSKLRDYVPAASTYLSDDELSEGPARITLHCPISYRRIVTPVKGATCRHHQCFDYENFMEINSRRPSWRCPYCNGHISCPDLRLDQKMVQVLKEVSENVTDVMIKADGSWKAMADNMKDKSQESNEIDVDDALDSEGQSGISNSVIDLTAESSEPHGLNTIGGHSTSLQGPSNAFNAGYKYRDTSGAVDRKPDSETLRRICINDPSPSALLDNTMQTSNRLNAQVGPAPLARDRNQVSVSIGSNVISMPGQDHLRPGVASDNSFAPVYTDAVSSPLSRGLVEARNLAQAVNPLQSLPSTRYFVPTENRDLHLAHSIHGTSNTAGEVERHSSRFVTRAPIAIQALPAQTQVANTRPRNNVLRSNSSIQLGGSSNMSQQTAPLASSNTSLETAMYAELEMQQLLSRQSQNPQPIVDHPASLPMHFQPHSQNRDNQDRQHRVIQSFPPDILQIPTQSGGRNNIDLQHASTSRNSVQFTQEQQNQQLINQFYRQQQRVPSLIQQVGQSGYRQSPTVSNVSGLAPSPVMNQHSHTAQRTMPNQRPHSVQFSRALSSTNSTFQRNSASVPQNIDHSRITGGDQRWNSSTTAPVISCAEGIQETSLEQTWRPTGRMRGSIAGAGRIVNSGAPPYLNQHSTSSHARGLVGSTQSAGHANLLGATHTNMMQRPPLNTWSGDVHNPGSLWNPNNGTHLRSAGGNMATQVQGSDPNSLNSVGNSELEWLGMISDLQMPPNDASQMQG